MHVCVCYPPPPHCRECAGACTWTGRISICLWVAAAVHTAGRRAAFVLKTLAAGWRRQLARVAGRQRLWCRRGPAAQHRRTSSSTSSSNQVRRQAAAAGSRGAPGRCHISSSSSMSSSESRRSGMRGGMTGGPRAHTSPSAAAENSPLPTASGRLAAAPIAAAAAAGCGSTRLNRSSPGRRATRADAVAAAAAAVGGRRHLSATVTASAAGTVSGTSRVLLCCLNV